MTLRVSDHAVLRYLERVGGFEIDRLRAEIARRVSAEGPGMRGLTGERCVLIEGMVYVIREDGQGPIVTTMIRSAATASGRARLQHYREVDDG